MKKMKNFIVYRMYKKYRNCLSFNKYVVECQLPSRHNNIRNAMKENKDNIKERIHKTI